MVLLMAAILLPTCPNAPMGLLLGVFIAGSGGIMLWALTRQTSIERSIPKEKLKLANYPEYGMLITTMAQEDTCRLLITLSRQAGCEVPQSDSQLEFDVLKEAPSGEKFRCRFSVLAHNNRTYIQYQTDAPSLSPKELERESLHLLGGFIEWLPEGRVVESEYDCKLIENKVTARERVSLTEAQSTSEQRDTHNEM